MNFRDIVMKSIGFFVNRFVQDSVAEVEDGKDSSAEMKALCRRAVAESCVLLKNDGVLPIKEESVALFGRTQYDSFFTGYGSGGDVKAPYKVSIAEGLKAGGVNLNAELDGLYVDWCKKNKPYDGFWGFWPFSYPEMPISEAQIQKISRTSETAFFVIGRAAGEDRENRYARGSWFLTKEEENLLRTLRKHFQKVCVLLNCGSLIDMSWVETYGVDAVLYVWLGGQELGNGVADIVTGKVSPSGKLPDTIAPCKAYPSDRNFGGKKVSRYAEDIYVGYRYFETFAPETVYYPFGFGLSYTNFSLSGKITAETEEEVTLSVTVKNTGERRGKCVVQIYGSAPQGLLKKPKRTLLAFKKSKELESSEEERLSFRIFKRELASFDDTGAVKKDAFLLEEGEYRLFAGEDVRSAFEIGNFSLRETKILSLVDEICPPQESFCRMVNEKGTVAYESVPVGERNLKQRILRNLPKELPAVTQVYDFNDVLSGSVSLETFVASLSEEEIENLLRGSDVGMYDPAGASGNAGIIGGTSEKLRKRNIPVLTTSDGASGIRLQAHTSLIPISTALAATFNEELVEKIALETGKEMVDRGSDILLAPNVNLHRHPLGGRNFEYFSEDPVLSGKIASAFIRGVQSGGGSATVKHFACNNQETARHKNDSRVSARALREVYLKAFEICIEESSPDCLMMSYNKLNGVYNCYQYDLATTLLRKEWKYTGCVMTDWWMDYGSSPDFEGLDLQAYRVRAQIDVFMPGSAKFGKYKNKSDGSLLRALKCGAITKGELQQSAMNVLRLCIKRIKKRV